MRLIRRRKALGDIDKSNLVSDLRSQEAGRYVLTWALRTQSDGSSHGLCHWQQQHQAHQGIWRRAAGSLHARQPDKEYTQVVADGVRHALL